MKTASILLITVLCGVLLLCTLVQSRTTLQRNRDAQNADDGTKCAVCTLALTTVYTQLHTTSIPLRELLKKACDLISNEKANSVCKFIVNDFTEDLLRLILSRETPDYICSKVGLCKQCHLVHGQKYYDDKMMRLGAEDKHEKSQLLARVLASVLFTQLRSTPEPAHVGGFPKIDLDGDHFSPVHIIPRGADWRGADCNDWNKDVKPGQLEKPSGALDHDCNGIPADAEQKYCSGDNAPRQVVVLGDSASAGFGIEPQWLQLKNLSSLLNGYTDEFDHPDKVWGSGWIQDNHVDSLYSRLRNNNRCYHRQFQNVAKNGGDSFDLVHQIDTVNWENSKPVIATVAYIGNDVCHNTLEEMTTPEEMEENLLAGLAKLDTKLPPNSRVLLFGLVDGSIIYDLVGELNHPLGENITYGEFYSFLSCTGMNPCSTWLNTDAATRAAASARAMELNSVVSRIAKSGKYNNFEITFVDFEELLDDAFAMIRSQGKPLSFLIDSVDGFHPNVNAQILPKVLWQHLSADTAIVGTVNPFNAEIERLYGNQGGY